MSRKIIDALIRIGGLERREEIVEKFGIPATSHYIHPEGRVSGEESNQRGSWKIKKIESLTDCFDRGGSRLDRAREHNNSIS